MVYIWYMLFEYDNSKSASNKDKHGIDFEEAKKLWDDEYLIEIPVKSLDEQRFLIIGLIGQIHWSAIVTYREGKIRIISVRRSRIEEVRIYEG